MALVRAPLTVRYWDSLAAIRAGGAHESYRRLSSRQPVGGSSRPVVTAVGSSMLSFQSSFAHPPSDTECRRAGRGRESRTSRPRPLFVGCVSPDEQVPQGLPQCQSGSRERQEPTGKHRLSTVEVPAALDVAATRTGARRLALPRRSTSPSTHVVRHQCPAGPFM